MKRIKRLVQIILISTVLVFSLVGCNKNDDTETTTTTETTTESTTEATTTETTEATTMPTEDDISEEETTTEDITATTELTIYVINPESLESEKKAVNTQSDIVTPQFLVDKVINKMAEDDLLVGIDFVKEEEDTVIVSFKSGSAPVDNVGSGIEYAILDSIANTLLDNLENCKNVIFRVEGDAYVSGHIEFKIDEPYKTK